MVETCQYCNKTLTSKCNLIRHQKTKKCLNIQVQLSQGNKEIKAEYQCKYCNKILSTKDTLKMHDDICINKYKTFLDEKDKIIESQKLEIEEFKIKLKTQRLEIENDLLRKDKEILNHIAQQPRTSTTNNNLIIPNIDTSQEKINKAVENSYDMNHFCSGQKGIARFAVDHILRDDKKQLGYICTDPARSVFKHVGEDGEIVRDMKATRLTTKLAVPIKEKAGKLATEMIDKDRELISTATETLMDIRLIENDNSVFRTELASVTSN